MRGKINTFFRKKITIVRWQFNFFGLACFLLVVGSGAYVMVDRVFAGNVPKIIAVPTNSLFSQGTTQGANYTGSGAGEKLVLARDVSGSASNLNYQADVLSTSGLVSYWKMDNDWTDAVGGLNNLTPSGVSFFDPKYGSNSASFNGGAFAYNDNPQNFPTGNTLTVEAWVYPTGYYDASYNAIAFFGQRNCTNAFLLSVQDSGRLSMANWCNDFVPADGPAMNLNTWNHVAAVLNGSTVTLYLNGAVASSSTLASPPDVQLGPIEIGSFSGGTAGLFQGNIDEVAVYNRALSSGEIANHFSTSYSTADGVWESAPINLNWNGGWNGTNSFSASVDVPVNTSVDFYVRAAQETGDGIGQLGSIAYVPVTGTFSNGTFTADLAGLGIPAGSNKFIQIKAVLRTTDNTKTPIVNSIVLGYFADGTPPTDIGNIGMKISPDADDLIQPIADGTHWTSYFQNNGYGYHPNFVWDVASDSESSLKGYCLYIGKNSTADPADNASYDDPDYPNFLNSDVSPILSSETGGKCRFVVPVNEVNGKNLFQSDAIGGSYRQEIYSTYDTLYLNVRAIDNENNVSDNIASYKFGYEDLDPSAPAYISLPDHYVSNKAVTMTWPLPAAGDFTGEKNKDAANDCWIISQDENGNNRVCEKMAGLLGYQYRINGGTWYGLAHNGKEDVSDVIPFDQGSFTFDVNEPDLHEGTNTINFRSIDNAGNRSNSNPSAVLRIDTTSPSEPLDVTASPANSENNSYAFSWTPPAARVGDVSKLDFCYTINNVPSEFSCTFTGQNFCVEDSANRGNYTCSLPASQFATRPGINIFYVVAKSETGVINYDNYSTAEFSYSGSAPGIARGIDVADISIKASSNWKLALSWEVPQDIGSGVDSYKIYRSDKNGTCAANPSQFSEVGSTGGTSYVDTGLSQKEYYYCVKSCDSGNSCSAFSATVSKTPTGKFTSPAKLLSGPDVDNITTKRATIKWSTDRDSDSKISIGEKSEDYLNEETSKSDQITDHSIELSNLSPGTKYYFRVKWTDEDGNTGISEEKTFETEPAPSVKGVEVNNIGINSAFVKFTTKNASKAKIYYGKSSAFGSAKEISTSKKESDYDLNLTDLDDDSKYYYKINTFDAEDSEYEGTTLDFTTMPRPKISNVQIQPIKDSAQPGVQITWNSNTEISSIVSYAPTNNSSDRQNEVQVDLVSGEHETTIMNLKPLTTYELVVKGVDRAGNEASSDSYTFTTASDTRPPQISEIVVEGASTQNQADKLSQLAVSWNTDEQATSQVEFGEGVGSSYTQKTQEDSNLTNNHLVIISGLTPSKVYHLRIISKDQAGNISNSPDTVSITPKAIDSAFELVVGNLMEVFGFLKGIGN